VSLPCRNLDLWSRSAFDVTDPDSIWAAVTQARDVTFLINNAGISVESDTLQGLSDQEFRDVSSTPMGSGYADWMHGRRDPT
jgi:NADP-dependent 3-hydroxy acid dehydrogenase YdfG